MKRSSVAVWALWGAGYGAVLGVTALAGLPSGAEYNTTLGIYVIGSTAAAFALLTAATAFVKNLFVKKEPLRME